MEEEKEKKTPVMQFMYIMDRIKLKNLQVTMHSLLNVKI
jgi:hypothetical protein